MIVTDGIPAAVYEYKRAKIDEDRHIDIYRADGGYGVLIYNGADITHLGLTDEAAKALWTGLGMWLEG
jgi:hypothetical protein